MEFPIGKKVIVRTNRAGVFYGTLSEYDADIRTAELTSTRRLWCWKGAASLSQLATEGTKDPEGCKFTVVVKKMQVMEVIEIIPCTEQAIDSIEGVKIWRIG